VTPEVVATGIRFPEGPVWCAGTSDSDDALVCTSVADGALERIHLADGRVERVAELKRMRGPLTIETYALDLLEGPNGEVLDRSPPPELE